MTNRCTLVLPAFLCFLLATNTVNAQLTEFTYQGNLVNSGTPANGNHDFEFLLFDALSGGAQLGTTQARNGVAVANGAFSVSLDFGNQFPGADRWIEIRVRSSGGGAFTPLAPRQKIANLPYAIRSQTASSADIATSATNAATATNALQLGGVAANQYVRTGDTRLSDARNPLPGSPDYIRNTENQQASSNFNISGTGTANVFNMTGQLNYNGIRAFAVPFTNVVVGKETGSASNNFPGGNVFVGYRAGQADLFSFNNTFVGRQSGLRTTNGNHNTFLGENAGLDNIGYNNDTLGGSYNTAVGSWANFGSGQLINSTAVGYRSFVTQSHSLVLGSINGLNGSQNDTRVGIGTTAPQQVLHVNGNEILSTGFQSGFKFRERTSTTPTDDWVLFSENGIGRVWRFGPGDIMTFTSGGLVGVNFLGVAGATALCRNASNQISTCSSSARYKSNITDFTPGLHLIRRLRPVAFDWAEGGMRDVGLIAEEVAAVEPLLATTNDKGQIEGVKYDQISVVVINAVKEQQAQIESVRSENELLKKQLKIQQETLNRLLTAICEFRPSPASCSK